MAGNINSHGYVVIGIKGKTYKAHRIIWLGVYGYLPEGDIDHKDKIKHHNWLTNLREKSHQCNIRNCKLSKRNKSGIKGISWNNTSEKWISQIAVNKKVYYLGAFKDFDEAVCHRLAAEQCLNWEGCDSESPAYIYVRTNLSRFT